MERVVSEKKKKKKKVDFALKEFINETQKQSTGIGKCLKMIYQIT